MSALFRETTQRRLVIPYRYFGIDIFRNVGNKLPLYVAQYPRGAPTLSESRQHSKIAHNNRII